jgi:tRNA dimethylallyltransferase
MDEYNCLVVLGPTASGKTRLAAQLAFYLNGEVISADSRQVYRGLDIGTGKDISEYRVDGQAVPYHLIDIHEPDAQFFLHHFIKRLREAFDDIRSRGKLPVICGGTGLYLDALRKDFQYTLAPEDHELREQLQALDKPALFLELQRLSPAIAEGIDMSSKKRLIRGIEIARHFGKTGLPEKKETLPYIPYYLGINSDPKERRKRIAARLENRIAQGLIEEGRQLLLAGVSHSRLQHLGLEYRFLSQYLAGQIDLPTMRKQLETAIIQFSKRQMTWFRRMERDGVRIDWVNPDADAKTLAAQLAKHFVKH